MRPIHDRHGIGITPLNQEWK